LSLISLTDSTTISIGRRPAKQPNRTIWTINEGSKRSFPIRCKTWYRVKGQD
jgi:hypothetical protein